jgi:hypothetical protein
VGGVSLGSFGTEARAESASIDVSEKATSSIVVLSEKNGLGGRSKWKTEQAS